MTGETGDVRNPFGYIDKPNDRWQAVKEEGMKVRFSTSPPKGDRLHHITPEDVEVVLSRLPDEAYSRLRAVHFNDRAWEIVDRVTLQPVGVGRSLYVLCQSE